MSNLFCCFKGANQVVQEPLVPPQQQQQQQQAQAQEDPPQDQAEQQVQQAAAAAQEQPVAELTDSSETIGSENHDQFEYNSDEPFGSNEYLNNIYGKVRDDPTPPAPESLPLSPPLLTYTGVTYQWGDILHGTLNFRQENFLGEGNFGKVYRCHLTKDYLVGAAKVQKLNNPFAHSEFVTEITTLHLANHPNVIKLLGKCFGRSEEQRVVIYEYMPIGSLDRYLIPRKESDRNGLFLPRRAKRLDWDTRMRIAVGVAKALVYLHTNLKVIHRDVKVSNVLLDEHFEPKLTDFGLVANIVLDENGVEVEHVVHPIKGTPGYVPPETEQRGVVSTKTDVFAYGVFLFSLFTGRRAFDLEKPSGARKLTDWLAPVWNRDQSMPMVIDPTLGYRYSVEGLYELFTLARMCTVPEVLERPNMVEVEQVVRQAAFHFAAESPSLTRPKST